MMDKTESIEVGDLVYGIYAEQYGIVHNIDATTFNGYPILDVELIEHPDTIIPFRTFITWGLDRNVQLVSKKPH